ncbi:hypothetical protein, partial [Pseudomonas rossensis]|uniref:hypothetical protein n=1 Tax=Pseudomonas rossensis TaxID=2305471 RepID=UPI003260CB0F
PKNRPLPSPPALPRPMSICDLELSSSPAERPNAHKSRAFGVNNVLDFAERISFFWHKHYEKFFYVFPQNVLSSVVTSMKRFSL